MNPSTRPNPSQTRPGRVGWHAPDPYPSTRPDPSIGTGRSGTGRVASLSNPTTHIHTRPAGRVADKEHYLMSRIDLDALYLTVACPTCKAPVATACTVRRTNDPDRTAHLARQDKAVRRQHREQEVTR